MLCFPVQIPGMTSKFRVKLSLKYPRSLVGEVVVQHGGENPVGAQGLELTGIREDCRETLSHHLTFHSILVGEGEALWSQSKVEKPPKFWLVASSLSRSTRRTFPSLCSFIFFSLLTSRNVCWFQNSWWPWAAMNMSATFLIVFLPCLGVSIECCTKFPIHI